MPTNGGKDRTAPDPLLDPPQPRARRCRFFLLPGRVAAIRTPNRHQSRSSISAPLSNPDRPPPFARNAGPGDAVDPSRREETGRYPTT